VATRGEVTVFARRSEIDPLLLGAAESAKRYASLAFSEGTRRVYASAWKAFDDFCTEQGLQSLPASGTTLSLWLALLADMGMSPRTLHVRGAAVRAMHVSTRNPDGKPYDSPTDTAEVKLVLKGIRRESARMGQTPEQADPVTADLLRTVAGGIGRGSTMGIRDAAIVLLGFASAMRRGEIAAMRVEHVIPTDKGLLIRIPLSKGDQEGEGQAVAVPMARDPGLCPVRALREWLQILRKENMLEGRVFREITTADRILPDSEGLTPESIGRIVRKRADAVGLEGRITAHSLRAGFATSALLKGAPIPKVRDHLRHTDVATTMRYFRDLERFLDHPGEGLL